MYIKNQELENQMAALGNRLYQRREQAEIERLMSNNKLSKKEQLVESLLDIQNNNWIRSGDRPEGMTDKERASLKRSHMRFLTIPMLEDMIENISIL